MGIFKKLIKATIHIATLPIDIVKDAATLGGEMTDQREPYSQQKFKKLKRDVQEIENEIDDL